MSEHRCNEIDNKIDRWINEVYAKNGKELVRLATIIEYLAKQQDEHHKRSEENKKKREEGEKELKEKLQPILDRSEKIVKIVDGIQGVSLTQKVLIAFLGLFISTATAYFLILKFFNK